jgi:hypothetical protein
MYISTVLKDRLPGCGQVVEQQEGHQAQHHHAQQEVEEFLNKVISRYHFNTAQSPAVDLTHHGTFLVLKKK